VVYRKLVMIIIVNQTLLLLLLAVDLEQKTSSRGKLLSTFPCGLCDHFVTWKCENTDHVLKLL
jgi:hypothetical protein